MAQTSLLIETLKKALKARGKTYSEVAEYLDLSEASVKRLFSEQSFSLARLDQVCQLLDMEISDLVTQMNATQREQISRLSVEQEREIAADLERVLITVCVLNHWTLAQILTRFNIPETQCIQHLASLDRLRLIELLPGNRIRLRVAPNFQWLENGPIQRFFQENLEAEFFRSRFDQAGERLLVANGMLSHAANTLFKRKLELLVKEFDTLANDDRQLPFDDRHGVTVVLAMRPWRFGLFDRLRKKES